MIFKFGIVKFSLLYMLLIGLIFFCRDLLPYSISFVALALALISFFALKKNYLAILLLSFAFVCLRVLPSDVQQQTQQSGICKIESNRANYSLVSCLCEQEQLNAVLYTPQHLKLQEGESYRITKPLKRIENQSIDGIFSFDSYLLKKNITHRITIKNESELVKIGSPNAVQIFGQNLRNAIHNSLSKFFSDQDKSLILALCFGDKTELESETLEQFRKAGLMHIIAVSGMHIGIIQLILLWFLGLFSKKPKWRIAHQILVIVLLVIFAWLCNFSSSVVRAVFMFSCLFYGRFSNRLIHSIHILFSTAFIVLLISPFQLFDLGFQMSYLATFGLLMAIPYIQKWTKTIRFKLLAWVVQLSLISITAQIFLLPLLLYYFGEIPVWFLAFNIPGFIFVAGILIAVMLFFSVMAISETLSHWLAEAIHWFIDQFLSMLQLLDDSSYDFFQLRFYSIFQIFVYGLLIYFLWNSLLLNKFKNLKYSILSLIILMSSLLFFKLKWQEKEELLFWNTNDMKGFSVQKSGQTIAYQQFDAELPENLKNYAKWHQSELKKNVLKPSETNLKQHLYSIQSASSTSAKVYCFSKTFDLDLDKYLREQHPNQEIIYRSYGRFWTKHEPSLSEKIETLSYGIHPVSTSAQVYFYL
ncbi:MAG: ComEC/Rec2 family competence protein [Flavobacteriales bacterium]